MNSNFIENPYSANKQPFLGREDYLNYLFNSLNKAISGQPQYILLEGDAAVGKSALLNEFSRRLLKDENNYQALVIKVTVGHSLLADDIFTLICEKAVEAASHFCVKHIEKTLSKSNELQPFFKKFIQNVKESGKSISEYLKNVPSDWEGYANWIREFGKIMSIAGPIGSLCFNVLDLLVSSRKKTENINKSSILHEKIIQIFRELDSKIGNKKAGMVIILDQWGEIKEMPRAQELEKTKDMLRYFLSEGDIAHLALILSIRSERKSHAVGKRLFDIFSANSNPLLVDPLEQKHQRKLIEDPLKSTKINFEPAVLDEIIHRSQGNILYLISQCRALYSKAVENHAYKINRAIYNDLKVFSLYTLFRNTHNVIMSIYNENLRILDKIFFLIAFEFSGKKFSFFEMFELVKKQFNDLSKETFSNILTHLCSMDVEFLKEHNGYYCTSHSLIDEYLQEVYGKNRKDEIIRLHHLKKLVERFTSEKDYEKCVFYFEEMIHTASILGDDDLINETIASRY
jgi:hypothetical protein